MITIVAILMAGLLSGLFGYAVSLALADSIGLWTWAIVLPVAILLGLGAAQVSADFERW